MFEWKAEFELKQIPKSFLLVLRVRQLLANDEDMKGL